MKKLLKSTAIIFSAAVMTFASGFSASAERRAVMNAAEQNYVDYLRSQEATFNSGTETNGYTRRVYYTEKKNSYMEYTTYDWNMDNAVDVADAQLALNDYVRFIALGNIDEVPQEVYDEYTRWCTLYRHSKPLTDPRDSLICAQATLEYYVASMSGNAYYTVWESKVWNPNTGRYDNQNPRHVYINKGSAINFYDWLIESSYYKNWKLTHRD